MTLWNVEGLKPIGYLAWPLRSLKVRNPFFTLTWPGDRTFGDLGLKSLHKVSNSIVSRYWKNCGAARRRFSAIREKPEGWTFFAHPSSARVNPRPAGGGAETAPPSTFPSIAQKRKGVGLRNFRQPLPTSILHMLTNGKFRTYDRSAVSDVRVTSCSAILGQK